MKPVLVLYATRDGHCRLLAQRVAERVRDHRLVARVFDAAQLPKPFTLAAYAAVMLIAPVHRSFHPREMEQFLLAHREEMARMPALLFSVSLSQAGVGLATLDPARREQARRDVAGLLEKLGKRTGLPTSKMVPVAGCLAYTRYGFFKRLMLRRIAKAGGGSTDTSRDHVYTDFAALDRSVDAFLAPFTVQAVLASVAPGPASALRPLG